MQPLDHDAPPLAQVQATATNFCPSSDFPNALDHLIDLLVARALLHVGKPAGDVRILREIAVDQLTDLQNRNREIVGDRDRVAAQVAPVGPDDMVVENLEPALGLFLSPVQRDGLTLLGRPLVVREDLWVDQPVAVVAVEVGVEPVHHLVDPRPLLQILRVGGRAGFLGDVFQDRRTLGQPEVAVVEHRHHPVGIDRDERLAQVFAGEQVHHLEFHRQRVVHHEQRDGPTRGRGRMHIELH